MNANTSADDNRVTTAHSVSSRDVGILGRYGRTRIVAVCFHLFHIPFSLARFLARVRRRYAIGTDEVWRGGTGVPPVNHAQDARATFKLHQYLRDLITSLLSTTSLRRVCASLCESRQVLLTSPWSRRASSLHAKSCRCVQLRLQPSRPAVATAQRECSQSLRSDALAIAGVARTFRPVAPVSRHRGFFRSSECRRCGTCRRTARGDARTKRQARCPSRSPSRHACFRTKQRYVRLRLHACPQSAPHTFPPPVLAYQPVLHDWDLRRCLRGSV